MDYYDIKRVIENTRSQTIVEKKKFNNIIDAVLDVIDNERMARGFSRSNKPSTRQTVDMIDMVAKRMGYKSGAGIHPDMEDEIRDVLLNVINNNKKEKLMKDNSDIKSVVEAYASIVNEKKNGNYYEIGGDRYDGGVVIKVYVDGKEVYDDILSGEQDYKYKGKKYDNVMKLLDAIAKNTSGISSGKDFERVKMK